MTRTPYDAVPYPSFAIRQTHISNLYLIGTLFGMQPPDCHRCTVLEIGGASGGNLIPMAGLFPQSQFICLDPSARQIEEGRRHAAALGLQNLRFEACSVEDFDRVAKCDYIICHGVFSWVPQSVQEAILEVLHACLTPSGIAFISYNTLPGWNDYRSLREAMLWHHAQGAREETKVQRAREMLRFVEKSYEDKRSIWGPLILSEIRRLAQSSDQYLLHEYLEEHNEPIYFSAFMERARKHSLQYLGDTDVHSMYVANLPSSMPAAIASGQDVEIIEQYIDFALNRRFRQTLLCRDSVRVKRSMALEAVDRCHMQSFLFPERRDTPDGRRSFRAANGATITTTDPMVANILDALARLGTLPASAETVIASVLSELPDSDQANVRSSVRRTALQAFFTGGLQLYALAPAHVASPSTRPIAIPVARCEATYRAVVTNALHEAVELSNIERAILQNLDGENTVEDIARYLAAEVRAGTLMNDPGEPLLAADGRLDEKLIAICSRALDKFAANALVCG